MRFITWRVINNLHVFTKNNPKLHSVYQSSLKKKDAAHRLKGQESLSQQMASFILELFVYLFLLKVMVFGMGLAVYSVDWVLLGHVIYFAL